MQIFLAIEVDSEVVGAMGVHLCGDVYHRTAEIGYWLSEEYWGRGKVLERAGFLLEAVHKQAITKQGKTLDEHLYVIFRL